MNIAIFNGSKNPRSSTEIIIKSVVNDIITHSNRQINVTDMSKNSENIKFCIGAKTCFSRGVCPLDKKDNFNIIKEDMNKADLIIIGTPVYGGAVSGSLKTFIDRISYHEHLMSFAGKACVIVITAQNQLEETTKYLFKVCSTLGLSVVAIISSANYISSLHLRNQIETAAKKCRMILFGDLNLPSNYFLEDTFSKYKQLYNSVYSEGYEPEMWNKLERNVAENFKDLLN